MKIIGTIEKSKTAYYSIYPDKDILDFAPFGYGISLVEAKEDFMKGIEEYREKKRAELNYIPKEFDNLIVEFRYDISTLFEAFDFLNVSKFAKYAGINESKMRQYTSGACDPGVKASQKISSALVTLGNALLSAALPNTQIDRDNPEKKVSPNIEQSAEVRQ